MSNVALQPYDSHHVGGIELALRFVLWAQQQRVDPTVAQIRDYFGCSRASAYRWRRAWLAANGHTSEESQA